MTSVQEFMSGYAKVRGALWGRPKTVNLALARRREAIEKLTLKGGTNARFVMENALSYWCFDPSKATGLRMVSEMQDIAIRVLLRHPGVSFDQVLADNRRVNVCAARRDIANTIRAERPDLLNSQIARFMKRDHSTLLHLLGRLEAKNKRSSKAA